MTTTTDEKREAMLASLQSVREKLERIDQGLDAPEQGGYDAELVFLGVREIREELERLEDTIPAIRRAD